MQLQLIKLQRNVEYYSRLVEYLGPLYEQQKFEEAKNIPTLQILDFAERPELKALAVALLYVFLVAFGATAIKRGRRHLVDRRERRDLSLYRIGRDLLERCLINGHPLTLRHVPYFA